MLDYHAYYNYAANQIAKSKVQDAANETTAEQYSVFNRRRGLNDKVC